MRVVTCLLLAALAATTVLFAQEQGRVVRELRFEGNRALDDYTLASAIVTTNSSWWARWPIVRWMGLGEKRYFDELEFRRDVVRVILMYRQSGYMNAVVDTMVRRTAKDAYIRFRIHEGPPVRVVRLDVKGLDSIYNVDRLKRELPLQLGDAFNRVLMQASADTIVGRLKNGGFPYAEVLRNFDSEAGALRAEVEFDAQPGPRMRVGQVVIEGLQHVDSGTVRRVMSVRSGQLFKQDDLYRTQRDLYGMGVFTSVNVVLIDSIQPQTIERRDSTVRILLRLTEGPRHQLKLGAGYASYECLRVQSVWTARDFMGGARTLDITGRLSKLGSGTPPIDVNRPLTQFCNPLDGNSTIDTLNYNLGVTLRQPAFLSRSHFATIGVFAERRSEFTVFTREAVGGNAEITFNNRGRLPVTLGYSYSIGHTVVSNEGIYCSLFRLCDDTSQAFLQERRPFGAVTLTLLRDRVNNVLEPNSGSIAQLTLLNASDLFGSKPPYEFNRGELEVAKYYLTGRRSVFAWHVRAGSILPRNLTLAGQRVAFVPPDQRFYGGGPNSVRGYGRHQLGPRIYLVDDTSASGIDTAATRRAGEPVYRNVTTVATGGNTVFIANMEWRFPSPVLAQRMRLGLFVDAGQVWEKGGKTIKLSDIRVTPGAGVRFVTPLGPVRIDVAYNGYALDRGPLLFQDSAQAPIYRIKDSYPPLQAPKSFWQKVVLQFAVGNAF